MSSVALRISIIYLTIGGAWILLSDRWVAGLSADPLVLTTLQTVKGWAYIFVTAGLLYLIIHQNFSALERAQSSLEHSYDVTLEGWAHALDLRDHTTKEHTERVIALTLRLARSLGLIESELVHLRRGALLHDIGKMGVPDSILLKPGALTAEEWKVMRQHPVYAHQMLAAVPYLEPALDIPYCHHEWWDGTGYPRGLAGEQIPLVARIFAVVDVWDALTSNRPYRPAWSEEKALDYIREQSGKHFDPKIADVFLQNKTTG